ncbi:two-partner secretion domain-containing protein [Myxosarcina sp. GI1(2024)]
MLLPFVFWFSISEINAIALGQVVPDDTLPNNSAVETNDNITIITGGSRANANLFHSFEQLSVISGKTVVFDNALDVKNIINRVTGNSVSDINGLIRANGTANLFLINPNGIIFGSNAALNIGGSFVGSTADSIQFQDGSEFSSSPTSDSPLLSVSIPIGLQLGTSAGKIVVRGTGNNLAINPDFSINRNNRPSGLQVPDGKTLALVGNKIELVGGNLTAAEGKIELWSFKNGNLSLNLNNEGVSTGQETIDYQNIMLSQAASVDASGNRGGEIKIRGENIAVEDGSIILTDTIGNGLGGTLTVRATESLRVTGISTQSPVFSGLLADVAPAAMGNGGNIDIKTTSLEISEGGQISSGTFGFGSGGNLAVEAENIKISGISPFGPSGLFAPVAPGARGNGGNLNINTGSLNITNGGQILGGTFGFGNAGELKIVAESIKVIGGTEFGPSFIASTVETIPGLPEPVAAVLGVGLGNGGNLEIETENLRVADGGQVAVTTTGSGKGGNLLIEAQNIKLSDFNQFTRSGLFASAIQGTGNGGDLNITTDSLSIQNGAVISAGNFPSLGSRSPGEGKAGNVLINARSVELNNITSDISSGITASTNGGGGGDITLNVAEAITLDNNSEIAAETRGSGDGGNVAIVTDALTLNNGGSIDTSTSAKGNGGRVNIQSNMVTSMGIGSGVFSEVGTAATGNGGSVAIGAETFNLSNKGQISVSSNGLGKAGNVVINAEEVNVSNGKIATTATQTGGGNINLVTDFLYLTNNSELSSSVLGSTGGGGNIFIDSNYVIANHNSDIRANAVLGNGGNINIDTEVILLSTDSDIDASSQLGLDGVVNIDNVDSDEQIGTAELPSNIVDPATLISGICPKEEGNFMAVTGKGGLSENPSRNLRGESVWEDLRDFSLVAKNQRQYHNRSDDEIDKIVETKGWQVNSQGNIELLGYLPQQNDQDYWQLFNQCR